MENFDWKFYLKLYPDLVYNGIDNQEKAFNHWSNNGINEKRICNVHLENFNWKFYIESNIDLKQSKIDNKEDAVIHWITKGQYENRICIEETLHIKEITSIQNNEEIILKQDIVDINQNISNDNEKILTDDIFDWVFYTDYYKDLKDNNINDINTALDHWVTSGKNEKRIPNIASYKVFFADFFKKHTFDWNFYKNFYPDLKNNNIDTEEKYFYHWVIKGKNEGRFINNELLNKFDWIFYINNYDDLKNICKKEDAIAHYYNIGIDENRIYYDDAIKKYSIVMVYHNQINQIMCILNDFQNKYNEKYNFEVIIVDNNSNDENKLYNIINNYLFEIKYLYLQEYSINTGICYNKGFNCITGDVVIIQSPECYHYTNILENIQANDFNKFYYTVPTISALTTNDNEYILSNLNNKDSIMNYLNSKGCINDPPSSIFLIISKNNLDLLEGFNETYENDNLYVFDELLYRAKKILTSIYLDDLSVKLFNKSYTKNEILEDISSKNKFENFKKTDIKNISWNTYEKKMEIIYKNYIPDILENNRFITFIIASTGNELLTNTINSLLNLSDDNWKAIIVLDGVKNNLLINDIRVSIIESDNNLNTVNRISFIRNVGLKNISSSEWVGFLDEGDHLSTDYINNLKDEISKTDNLDVCIFRMGYENKFVLPEKKDKTIIRCKVGISFAFKKNILNKIFFKDELYEDYLYLKELEKNKYKIIISQYVSYFVKTKSYICDKFDSIIIASNN